jgi:2-C-methyl-D-erythritol 4-phosphate cytidylyltransferase
MGGDKLALLLDGVPVIARTLGAFQQSGDIDEIVVVTKSEKIPETAALCRDFGFSKVKHITEGADNRSGSALRGVMLCSDEAKLIAIHDGARPFVTHDVIARAVAAAAAFGAAAPAVGVKDTVRQARGGIVIKTLAREELYLMQTPQVFEAGLIRRALADAVRLGLLLTDDCEAVMLMDAPVHLVAGSEENIKLTTPSDLNAAKAILELRGELE